jgi:hypothetical protein
MPESAASVVRSELQAALAANTARLRDALHAELARDIALDEGRCLQFEIDPCFFGIHSCSTEEIILPGDWLNAVLPSDWFERAELAEGSWDAMISEELCPWFAASWQAAGGPTRFSPTFLFFHGYHGRQYDLERRCWLLAEEVFGK